MSEVVISPLFVLGDRQQYQVKNRSTNTRQGYRVKTG